MANITGHRGKDISTILQAEEGKENGCPPQANAAQRRKKRRRLNDLDSDSTVDEEESEEEFRLSETYVWNFHSPPEVIPVSCFLLNSLWFGSALRKSLLCPTTRRNRKLKQTRTAATMAAGGTLRRGAGGRRDAGRAPGRGGDQSGTRTMKRRRMMKWTKRI